MKKFSRFFLPLVVLLLAGTAAYAGNHEAKYFLSNGEAKLKAGNYKEAIADFTKAIEYEPKLSRGYLSEVYFKRGFAKSALGDNEGAKGDYRISIELDRTPKDAEAYYNRGTARSFTGDNNGALADYTKAIDLNPAYGEAYAHRGKIKEAMGDKHGAKLDYKHAEKFHGTLP